MFAKEIYVARRRKLVATMARRVGGDRGMVVFLGNADAPQNYRGNDYKFRQESSFLYFWGLDEPLLAASLDLESGQECIYGNDVDIEDIIWMGPQPSVSEKAASVGVVNSAPYAEFDAAVGKALSQGRPVHYLPPSRYYNEMKLKSLFGEVRPSRTLMLSVIDMRLVKEPCEIEALDHACEIGYEMHTEARRGCKPGALEQDIVGRMEGVTISKGWGVSFTTILSQHGETMHNHLHDGVITPGRLLLVDAGAESNEHYPSDHTRTYPCSGKFTQKQKDIYDIVCHCNDYVFEKARPGVEYRTLHLRTEENIISGLKDLGLLHGDVPEMLALGIAGLFMPHGLGHNIGLDVHDMEDIGEDMVGYDIGQVRDKRLGLGNLRMARRLRPGHVVSDEPGIYFIPALIQKWKSEGIGRDYVNYAALEKYYDFGGIRLEDDLLITEDGCRRLGSRRLPILSSEIEEIMAGE